MKPVIEGLAQNPRPPDCKKLKDMDDLYRVRVGDYRIIYQVKDEEVLVLVVRVAHRKDAY
jgi:mRNA interferase RelE/StbE